MSKVIFKPWKGRKFAGRNHFGVRVLVLGESHYGKEPEKHPDITTKVVEQLAKKERYAFFTKISKVLLEKDKETWLDDESRGEVWDHIAFYNYIQEFVGTGPRKQPTRKMWDEAEVCFPKILDKLKPQVVWVLGKRLDDNLPQLFPKTGIEVAKTFHPSSSRFTYNKAIPEFHEACERARKY